MTVVGIRITANADGRFYLSYGGTIVGDPKGYPTRELAIAVRMAIDHGRS